MAEDPAKQLGGHILMIEEELGIEGTGAQATRRTGFDITMLL